MASNLLTLHSLPPPNLSLSFPHSNSNKLANVDRFFSFGIQRRRKEFSINRRRCFPPATSKPAFVISSSLQAQTTTAVSVQEPSGDTSVLLDVSGMMCGGCVSRVRSLLSSDERVDSVAVNMLTETAAIKLKSEVAVDDTGSVAESLARRLTECGFSSKRRESGRGVAENVRKWKEMLKKKDEMLVRSRNRVAFAWTLVALCCGSHGSHILHSLGIHVAHGSFFELLHNSYLKGGLALGALLGPGRGFPSLSRAPVECNIL
ncbi:hypothetical protein G4B88_003546 [Cannabis sativa]|uniref:HMA domain-containing protein n=1 Tax=Cannabis sativa TaxID=3483 RepID=A0A7J6GW59_CANSA|nr:hypothetical protein G4B88_003546 [Cannabis sativa]